MDWQTYTAAAIVGITMLIFIASFLRPKKKSGGCGHNCGCGNKPKEP